MIDNLSPELKRRWEGYVQRYQRLYNDFFEQQFGEAYEGHQLFAYHAVFPGIVTPDLLYQIWFNFRVYPSRASLEEGQASQEARIFAFPNFSVSDFLQSSLCQEVGFQQYAIDHELRVALLEELRQDPRFGEDRIQHLAALLEQYRRQYLQEEDLLGLGEYHRWVARASLNPESMAQELGLRLADLVSKASQDRSQLIEIRKMKRLLQDLSKTDQAFQDLADYSAVMDDYLVGNKVPHGREMVLSSVPQGAGAVAVPIFRELQEAIAGGKKEFVRKPFEAGKNKIYALIVGINLYRHEKIPDLQGPVKDALAMEAFLRERFEEESLMIQSLYDEQATRKRIINGFLHHLATAGPGDVVLFFFAGQGTQEEALDVFWDVEPDHKLETLIPHDGHGPTTRATNEAYHLAQREINALIWLLDKRKPNIAMIVDACHSGRDHETTSGEEALPFEAAEEGPQFAQQQQRMTEQMEFPPEQEEIDLDDEFFQNRELIWEEDWEPRQPEEFLFCQLEEFGDTFRSLFETEGRISSFPEGTHAFFASGMSHEQAFEARMEGEFRGIFSYELIEELRQLIGPISNEELMKRVRERVQEKFKEQTPQLYVEGEISEQDEFLFGAMPFEEHIHRRFVLQLGQDLAFSIPEIAQLMEGQDLEEFDERELMSVILNQFPYPIAELLWNLFISQRDQLPRMLLAGQLVNVCLEYTVFILLTELANFRMSRPQTELSEALYSLLENFLRPREASFLGKTNVINLIREGAYFLMDQEHEFLGDLWIGLDRTLDEYWESAYRFFIRPRSDEEVEPEHEQLDEQLNIFLRPLAFLAHYRMQSIKEVEVRKSILRPPIFRYQYTDLMGINADLQDQYQEMERFPDSHSVLVWARNASSPSSYLNLTPFVLDDRALQGEQRSQLFFFSHMTASGEYVYRDAMSQAEVPLVISVSDYPEIVELWDRLEKVLWEGPEEDIPEESFE